MTTPILKTYMTPRAKSASANGRMLLDIAVATDHIDREGDQIVIDGIDTKAYLQSPVVQWAHTYDQPPIAKTVKLWKQRMSDGHNALMARAEFVPDSLYGSDYSGLRPSTIWRMYSKGYLSAASIGFIDHESEPLQKEPGQREGKRYTKTECLEWSLVPVPANAAALAAGTSEAKQFRKALRGWAQTTLKHCEQCERDDELVIVDIDMLVDEIEAAYNAIRERV